ncbi:TnpV protein [Bariatricus sp. HCP28S3_E4]|uniref:TnpV protein n=1 Tax=unclassified Bariatricus TaxID=2677046 RepID=UPI003F8C4199
MSKQKNNDVIREDRLEYLQIGDYFIPDLKLPQENRSIGRYGRMHRDYLQEHNPIRFDDLVLEGKLWIYLADLNEQAQNRLQLIIRQMQEEESVNDELKENNQIAWVQAMNSIHKRAEEIVLHELVYGEDT